MFTASDSMVFHPPDMAVVKVNTLRGVLFVMCCYSLSLTSPQAPARSYHRAVLPKRFGTLIGTADT